MREVGQEIRTAVLYNSTLHQGPRSLLRGHVPGHQLDVDSLVQGYTDMIAAAIAAFTESRSPTSAGAAMAGTPKKVASRAAPTVPE